MKSKNSSFLKTSEEFFKIFPFSVRVNLRKEFYNSPISKRQEIWNDFKLPVIKIEKKFIELSEERRKLAFKADFSSYAEMFLDKYKIPSADYEKMLKNIDKLLMHCNKELPSINPPALFYSKYNNPCYICQLKDFPIKSEKQVVSLFIHKYNELKDIQKKIAIDLGGKSSMYFDKKTGTFQITLDNGINKRHQLLDLVHEMAHVVVLVKNPELVNEGSYSREKKTLKIETQIIKVISKNLYKALFGDFLKVYWRTLFEIKLYENPNQNLRKLYAEIFNKVFSGGKQKDNPFYLLDTRIVLRPFSNLPHVVSISSLISEGVI